MSTSAPETPPRPAGPSPGPGGGNPLTRHYGPLPGWVWISLIGATGALAWFMWERHRKGSSSSASSATTTSAAAAGTSYAGQIAALQAEIQDLQGGMSKAPGTAGTTTKTSSPPTGTGPVVPVYPGVRRQVNGQASLNEVAKGWHTTPAQVIATTYENDHNQWGPLQLAYLAKNNFNAKLPANSIWWSPGK